MLVRVNSVLNMFILVWLTSLIIDGKLIKLEF
jgi:hypothetical protein